MAPSLVRRGEQTRASSIVAATRLPGCRLVQGSWRTACSIGGAVCCCVHAPVQTPPQAPHPPPNPNYLTLLEFLPLEQGLPDWQAGRCCVLSARLGVSLEASAGEPRSAVLAMRIAPPHGSDYGCVPVYGRHAPESCGGRLIHREVGGLSWLRTFLPDRAKNTSKCREMPLPLTHHGTPSGGIVSAFGAWC